MDEVNKITNPLYKELSPVLKTRVNAMAASQETSVQQISWEINNCYLAAKIAEKDFKYKDEVTITELQFRNLKEKYQMQSGGINRRFLINMGNSLKRLNNNKKDNNLIGNVLTYRASFDQHGEQQFDMMNCVQSYITNKNKLEISPKDSQPDSKASKPREFADTETSRVPRNHAIRHSPRYAHIYFNRNSNSPYD